MNLFFSSAILLILLAACGFITLGLGGGLPFIPTKRKRMKNMIDLLKVRQGAKAADLGCGDGRFLIEFVRAGVAEAHGYEINPLLVWWARYNIKKAGCADRAFVHKKSFWDVDMRGFDLVTVYGIGYIMGRLEKKLRHELKKGARVVSNGFPFPTWPHVVREDGLYMYEQKE